MPAAKASGTKVHLLTDEVHAIREWKRVRKRIAELNEHLTSQPAVSKYMFLLTEEGKAWLQKRYVYNCPLCSYAAHHTIKYRKFEISCQACREYCPLQVQFGTDCEVLGYKTDPVLFAQTVAQLKEE